jgi:hypothetical protein
VDQRQLPQPEDEHDRFILENIERVGWSVIGIEDSEEGEDVPTYSFSVGIYHTLGQSELLVMGLKPQTATVLINNIGEAMRQGRRFAAGDRAEDVANMPVAFVAVDPAHYRKYVGYIRWLYRGSGFPLLQCVWPDGQGVFPWEPGYDSRFFESQRVLGPVGSLSRGWLFPGPPNQATFTVRQVLGDGKPILHVTHDPEDGGWQFLTGDPVKMADALLVSLASVVQHDPSVAEVADLPPGWTASRRSAGEPWQRQRRPETEE